MHNNIMAAGLRDRPPMLATGIYAQWRSHFLRYIDTKTNGDALRKCILESHEMWEAIERLQQDEHAPAPEHDPIAPNPAPIQPNNYLADDDEDPKEEPKEEEEPIPKQALAGFAPQ
ncbi:hypothetical protein Tco_1407420 [Tanacetum coccineum]